MPMDTNILEWHYVITGTKGSPYEGGHYHGKLKFPPEVNSYINSVKMRAEKEEAPCRRCCCTPACPPPFFFSARCFWLLGVLFSSPH